MWLLSVVAKQDLWVQHQAEVEKHYLRDEYAKAIAPVAEALGHKSFRHEVAFVSLVLKNLRTIAGEEIADTAAGYDMTRASQSIHNLVHQFVGLRDWEGTS